MARKGHEHIEFKRCGCGLTLVRILAGFTQEYNNLYLTLTLHIRRGQLYPVAIRSEE